MQHTSCDTEPGGIVQDGIVQNTDSQNSLSVTGCTCVLRPILYGLHSDICRTMEQLPQPLTRHLNQQRTAVVLPLGDASNQKTAGKME